VPKPLTITSTTNAHALAVYVGMTILGGLFTFTPPPVAIVEALGLQIAGTAMGLLMLAGGAAFSASMVGARKRDPTTALSVEMGALGIAAVILAAILRGILDHYGLTAARISVVCIGAILFGSIGRLYQAGKERRLLIRARRQRQQRTVEVTAEPDSE